MSITNKTEAQLQKELLETVQEVGELLKKSGLAKADEDEVGEVPPEHAEPDADQMGGPSDNDADNMPPAPEGEEGAAPEGAPEGEEAAAPEGEEGGDMSQEMAAHAAELSDEELQAMLEVLMAEVEKRHAGAAGAEEGAAGAQPPAAAPEGAEPMAASMKKEFSSLAKSVADIAEAVKNLNGEVGSLKKSVSDGKRQATITSKPAAVNQNVQVLQKSNTPKEKLNKSDTLQFLLSEQRNGNKKVNSDYIATINACRNDEELAAAQRDLEKIGIKIPTV